jgi:signal peptidase I
MKKLKCIFAILGTVLLAASCCSLILLHWSAFGWKAESIPTGSMRPGIPPGSAVFVHSVPDSSLKIGDVITYIDPLNPKTTISHRIIKEYLLDGKIPAFVTKGDANPSADVPIVAGLIVGKVVWHINFFGYIMLWSKTIVGIAALIWLPALIIIMEEIVRLNDYYKSLVPYRLKEYSLKFTDKDLGKTTKKFAYGSLATFAVLIALAAYSPDALALLKSNTVSIINNNIKVAKSTAGSCSGNVNNNTNINIRNSNPQSAKTGNTSSNDGNATSGGATNNSSIGFTINVNDC